MKNIKHRDPLKRYFLTFPTCKLNETELWNILEQPLMLTYGSIVQEDPKDGQKHLYAIIYLQNKINKNNILKILKRLFPDDWKRVHIKSLRSHKFAYNYISKYNDPIFFGELPKDKAKPYLDMIYGDNYTFFMEFEKKMNKIEKLKYIDNI